MCLIFWPPYRVVGGFLTGELAAQRPADVLGKAYVDLSQARCNIPTRRGRQNARTRGTSRARLPHLADERGPVRHVTSVGLGSWSSAATCRRASSMSMTRGGSETMLADSATAAWTSA
jgi:hypothetical protein